MNKHLSIRIPDELLEKIKECAKLLQVSPSDIVRRIISNNIDREKENIKQFLQP